MASNPRGPRKRFVVGFWNEPPSDRGARPCLGCLHCMDVRLHNKPVTCRVNARLNRERELTYTPAKERKKVLVVGSGPAGMEAARVAALRGHEVILYERARRLGGSLNIAVLPIKGSKSPPSMGKT